MSAMSRRSPSKDDLELVEIREAEQQLLLREKEFAENQKRITRERIERECTMPPLDEIESRARRKQHEEIVSRGAIANVRRDQNRSLMMLFLLVAATCSLVWWGLRLMQGG
jgi:hypothetical protein